MTTVVFGQRPTYGHRKGWIPRTLEDYGDGGAFPEIHVAQYPLNMGRNDSDSTRTLPITLDAQGRIKYESVVNPGNKRNVLARYEDSVAAKIDDSDNSRPSPEEIEKITEKTKQALEQVLNKRIAASAPKTSSSIQEAQYIKYTPSQQGAQFNSGAQQRIIRLTEMPQDPLDPPKFKHKKLPRGPPSPPVPVMHSPPKKLTVKDQQDWKIPPCISNWKNNKGYTIPLDKRLAADGRGLAEVTINDNFAKLSEALYVAERTARDEVSKRAEIEKKLKVKEKEKKEELLRKLAQEARMERTAALMEAESGVGVEDEDTKARLERDRIREERRRERERDLRMQRNKSAATRNAERDVSERVALGQAVPQQSSETLYDQRLFNQTQGISSGFGEDDSYNIYSKPLFQGSSANFLYRPKKSEEEEYGNEEDLKKLHDTSKFRPDKDFSGVDRTEQKNRSQPVEFEKEEDPFGLNEFLTQAKSSSKGALDKIGSRGHMHVSSGSTESLSKRSRIDFQTSSESKEAKKSKN